LVGTAAKRIAAERIAAERPSVATAGSLESKNQHKTENARPHNCVSHLVSLVFTLMGTGARIVVSSHAKLG
jgi:hypothetical protein